MANPMGRPNKFTNLRSLQNAINRYFHECDGSPVEDPDHPGIFRSTTPKRPYTVTGLARALGTNRQTLCNIENLQTYSADFIDTIKDAKLRCEIWLEESMLMGTVKPAAAIFALKNNYEWKDESVKKVEDNRSPADILEERRRQVLAGRGRTPDRLTAPEPEEVIVEVESGSSH